MRILDLGLVEYESATQVQLNLVEQVAAGAEECVVFCRHPRVVTLGRASGPDDKAAWDGPAVETSRGGRATYHGPGQIVIYPILDLKRRHRLFPERDLHGYMRALEVSVCRSLHEIGIPQAEARTVDSSGLSLTGVWVGTRKIASIGIAVRRWTTYHGCAINVENDPDAFRGIQPCGFQSSVMTSVEDVMKNGHREELQAALTQQVQSTLGSESP